jgi:hypothetical protein
MEGIRTPATINAVYEQAPCSDEPRDNTGRKRGKRNKVITVSYMNEMPPGALEKALANIYATKINNGGLDV